MKQDPANAGKSESEIWIMDSGGPNRGRIYGFGSKIDRSCLQTGNTRSRTVYPSTETRPEGRVYTAEEVEVLLEDRDRHYREESAQRERLEDERSKRYDILFAQLFTTQGRSMPMVPTAIAQDLQGMMQSSGGQAPIQNNLQGPLQANGSQAPIQNINFQAVMQASGGQGPIQNNYQGLMKASGSQAQIQYNYQGLMQASGSQAPIQNNFQSLMQAAIGSQAPGQNNLNTMQQGFNPWLSDTGANGSMFFGN